MDASGFVQARGGVAPGRELLDAGCSRRELTRLVADGTLRRPRLGWYSTLAPSEPRFRAVRLGGRLTGASAIADMGGWLLRTPSRVEVSVARGSARLRDDPSLVVHWEADSESSSSHAVVGLGSALSRVILDHDLEVSVPCVDWARATGRMDAGTWASVVASLPVRARSIRDWVDPKSESVLESVARVRLLRAGMAVTSQVPVGWSQSIDLVVADSVALELDGKEHHEHSFERDRRKDLRITIEGRHSIRVTYSMLVRDWPEVQAAVDAALRARGLARLSVTPPPEPSGSRRFRTVNGRTD